MQKPENRAIICKQQYKTDVVLAAIFCFAYLKVNDTKDRILTDISTQMSSKFQCFSPPKYTHFHKKAAIFSHLKMYMRCANLNHTQF